MSLLSIATAFAIAPALGAAQPLIVSTGWLADHLKDRGLVTFQIGDTRSRKTYDAGHIPGAQFLNPFVELAAPRIEGGLMLELPSPPRLDSVLKAKGISNDSHIVLYSADEYFSPTSRAFFTLQYAGLEGRISILDGGLEAWKTEQRPVTNEVPIVSPGTYTPTLHPEIVVDGDWVRQRLDNPKVTIIDARDSAFFNGADTHQTRSGRIPGAVSLPFDTMIDKSGKFKDRATVQQMFAQAGVKPGSMIVTYCHIGQQATLVWFVAKYLGLEAALYDGSFQDWSAHRDYPVIVSAGGSPKS